MNVEQQIIDLIKLQPGCQVFPGSNGGSIRVAITRANSVKQVSVWLGRSGTEQNLKDLLNELAVFIPA